MPEAALAYSDAFDLRRDPRVGGRLGVVLVQLDNAVVAADLLMNALERASDASPDERLEFFKAYEIARSRVCRLEVTVSEAHARISLDGRVTQPDGVTAFAMFVPPGEHDEGGSVLRSAEAGETGGKARNAFFRAWRDRHGVWRGVMEPRGGRHAWGSFESKRIRLDWPRGASCLAYEWRCWGANQRDDRRGNSVWLRPREVVLWMRVGARGRAQHRV